MRKTPVRVVDQPPTPGAFDGGSSADGVDIPNGDACGMRELEAAINLLQRDQIRDDGLEILSVVSQLGGDSSK